MNIVDLYLSRTICGYPMNVFENILRDRHPQICVKKHQNGLLMFSDNTVIECIKDCYKNNKKPFVGYSMSGATLCHKTINHFRLIGIPVYNCIMCHLACLEKIKQGELKRKE